MLAISSVCFLWLCWLYIKTSISCCHLIVWFRLHRQTLSFQRVSLRTCLLCQKISDFHALKVHSHLQVSYNTCTCRWVAIHVQVHITFRSISCLAFIPAHSMVCSLCFRLPVSLQCLVFTFFFLLNHFNLKSQITRSWPHYDYHHDIVIVAITRLVTCFFLVMWCDQ